jgi:hypothetical protein
MRKKEYISIHALIAEVTRYLIEDENLPAETLADYHVLGTSPSNIHKSKQQHHEAIIALIDAIEPWFEQLQTENQKQAITGTQ